MQLVTGLWASAKAGAAITANNAAIIAITVRTEMMRLIMCATSFSLCNPLQVAPLVKTMAHPLGGYIGKTTY
jgi:hypothetical protein